MKKEKFGVVSLGFRSNRMLGYLRNTIAGTFVSCASVAFSFYGVNSWGTQRLARAEEVASWAPPALAQFSIERYGGPLFLAVSVDWGNRDGRDPEHDRVCKMLLDTGSTATIFDIVHRSRLGSPRKKVPIRAIQTASGSLDLFEQPTLHIGPVTVTPAGHVGCMDLRWLAEPLGESIDGVLGMDVLRQLVFSIDFDNGIFRLHREANPAIGRRVPVMWDDDLALAFHSCARP
jgi:hypothetical protein